MTNETTDIKQRLEYLAEEVEPASPSAAARLRNLSIAVQGGVNAETWANTNIFQVVEPDTIAEQIRTQGKKEKVIRTMEMLRNALVFVPIAITWIGIWLALDTYSIALNANPQLADLSFLYLWQQGFEGRTWLTLSRLALIDGVLLLLVFALTVLVLWYTNRKEQDADEIRDEVADALADAALVLNSRRTQQTTSFVHQFDQMARGLVHELGQERKRVEELAARKEREVGDLSAFVQDFMRSTQSLLAAVQAVEQVPQQLGSVVNGLSASFQHLTEQQRDYQHTFTQATQQVATHLNQLTDVQRATGSSIQATGTNLQGVGVELKEMSADLRDAIHVANNLAMQNAQAISDMHATARNLASAQTQFRDSLAQERETIERGTQGMQTALQSLQQDYQSLEQGLQALSQFVGQLSSQQQEFVSVTQRAVTEFGNLTEEQQTIGINLQTMGINLQKMGVDLRNAVESLHTATSETAHAASEISKVLPAVVHTQTQLTALLNQSYGQGNKQE
jgi:methyl-accepting chemotaxis protein